MIRNLFLFTLRRVPIPVKKFILRSPMIRNLRNAMYSYMGKRVVAVEPINSLLQIDFTRSEQRALLLRNYEPEVRQYMCETVKPGDAVIDVGAHIGYYTLLLSHLVGPSGFIIAFEPFADNAKALHTNVLINERDNVIVEEMGLADFTGQADLYIPSEAWKASLTRLAARKIPAEFITFDKYIQSHPHVAEAKFIKVDVEGAELQVVTGMQRFLQSHKPCFLIEFNSDGEYRRVRDTLAQLGYKHFEIIGEGQYGFWVVCRSGA